MSRENAEVVRAIYGPWRSGDFSSADWASPSIEFKRFWGDRPPDEWRGLDAVIAGLWEYIEAFEDLRVESEKFVDLGDRVLVHTRHHGTGKLSRIPYEKEMTDLVTVRDGQIVRWEAYWSREEALKAAGLRE